MRRNLARRAVMLAVLPVLVAVLVAQPAAAAPRQGHESWTQTFVDTSRPTGTLTGPPIPSRTLETAIYRPKHHGTYPTIVFAHGLDGHPDKFTKLFSAWADAGYVVIAPAFPRTNDHSTNIDPSDVFQQPGDMSFVLDQVLALDQKRGDRLYHAIDQRRIGAAGLSLGGITTYLLVYGDCCRDGRFHAAEVLDGLPPNNIALDGHAPLYIGHSDTDPVLPYSTARNAYEQAQPPVWLVTLHGASHASQWEDDVTAYDSIAEHTTTDFWDATLKGHRRAFDRLDRDATVPGLSSIEHKGRST